MKICKDNLKLILDNKKQIEKLFDDFIINYGEIFNKKEKLEYEQIINLDFDIYNSYLNFISTLVKIEFDIELIKDNHIKKIILDMINTTKKPPEEFYQSINFDHLYYSYLLCEMYIVIPYILQIYFEQEYKNKYSNWSQEKIDYKVKIHKLSKYMNRTVKCFENWDKLENKIDRMSLEINEKHPDSKLTYIEIQRNFSNLMNNFILIKFDLKISNKIIFFSRLKSSWYWLLIIALIVIGAIVAIVLFLSNPK